jgi:methionyl-tRNA synthetase
MVFSLYMWTPFSDNLFLGASGSAFGFGTVLIAVLFIVIAVWSLAWKTLAVWHAARNKQRLWMIALLLVNTVGVLEIIYLAWFRKDNNKVGPDELYPFLKDMKNPLAYEESSKDKSAS